MKMKELKLMRFGRLEIRFAKDTKHCTDIYHTYRLSIKEKLENAYRERMRFVTDMSRRCNSQIRHTLNSTASRTLITHIH